MGFTGGATNIGPGESHTHCGVVGSIPFFWVVFRGFPDSQISLELGTSDENHVFNLMKMVPVMRLGPTIDQ